jgi:hypothetical protein
MSTSQEKALKSKGGKRSMEYHLKTTGKGEHRVYDKATGTYGNFFKNKGNPSYGLKYKNTDLEFASSERHPSSQEKSERRHVVKSSKPLKLSH